MPSREPESGVSNIKVFNLHVVSFELAALTAVDNVIFLSDVWEAIFVLKEQCIVVNIETRGLQIFLDIPNYDAIERCALPNNDRNTIFVAPASYILDVSFIFFLRYVEGKLLDHFGLHAQLPDFA